MSAQHTPGPWNVSPPTRENPSRARVSALSGFVDIYDAPLTMETEANARLIAAAPELLEACQNMIRTHEVDDWVETFKAVREAIAKATGGPSDRPA